MTEMSELVSNFRPVFDNGFVILRNVSGPTRRPGLPFDGADVDPANAARMSFDQMDSGRTREMDLKLTEYLLKNRHTTPFEMIEIWIEMKLPIFVARQFVRHRTVSINEVSGRYVTLPGEWYIPALENVELQAKDKKQGGHFVDLSNAEERLIATSYRAKLHSSCGESYSRYKEAIAEGIANEQARLFLHLNHYTHWLWKQDLHNMMHFLSVRAHSHAQWEAQQYAETVISLLEEVLPESMRLFREFRQQ
jgi:thymidylate synthase (FAD)